MKIKTMQNADFKNSEVIAKTDNAIIYKLNNGLIFKRFWPEVIRKHKEYKNIGMDIEDKILNAKPLKNSPEILTPLYAGYNQNGEFMGYSMPYAEGISYDRWRKKLSLSEQQDLNGYGNIYSKLEDVVRRNEDIVFPDFCTCDNIYVNTSRDIQLIDYDGLQIAPYKSISFSTSIGSPIDYIDNEKYMDSQFNFTKELDKKSLIFLYYLTTFNVDLVNIGKIDPSSQKYLSLYDLFNLIGLDDMDLCHKTWKVFQNNQENDYLGDDVFRIAETYDLKIIGVENACFIKRLSKKR